MITLSKISKNFGIKLLFDDVTITFNKGFRYALTGPNGCGKTTLFKIMAGEEAPTSGTVTTPERLSVLKQNTAPYQEYRVVDVVIMGNARLWKALEERDQLYEMEMSDDVGMRLGELEGIIAEENGYSAEADAKVLLSGMGLDDSIFERKIKEIPSDSQFKVLLCQALFGDPDALLLDEPTNHLDLESIRWLEKFLFNYKGTLIVISHDRHFLNAVTTHIADIDYETVILYPGNYDMMVEAKTASRDQLELVNKSKEKKIAQLKEFVSRFGAGTRASQVQSRMREMERLQPQDLKKSNIQRPYIRFIPTDKQAGEIVLKLKSISKAYDHPVIQNFSFEVKRGDKIGVIGNNGRGKTTLLKMIVGAITPDQGKVELGNQVLISYFPQNHGEVIDKKTEATTFDWLREQKTGIYDQEIRSALGKMLFSGDEAFKKVKSLSGGETARLIIAGMLLSDHNTIILDEPNNHLDLEAVSALGWALNEYKGTVIVASHDRDLITTVANKIIAFEADGIRFFDGNLEEYLETIDKA